ncbi:hypothetical protein EHO59_07595 [Leptospira semungkisensis]|uniref:XRE family transcriptional regulator n=1 Tax=Leptospira semungkisensis TaxID=2484985 RepID=A0A4R9G8G2_9LEPT|nr:hypothetical protein [Leptospira semungkisensis]TGK07948.1 hypothetical protein EHO59_07595 [Leptospira semungkisensis]
MSKIVKKLDSPGLRLQHAFKELGITREDGAECVGVSVTTMNRYLCDMEQIPEIRMDFLLIKKGISKTFVFDNKGEPKASWDERLAFLDKEKALIKEIRHNAVLKELVLELAKLNERDLLLISSVVSRLK